MKWVDSLCLAGRYVAATPTRQALQRPYNRGNRVSDGSAEGPQYVSCSFAMLFVVATERLLPRPAGHK